MLNRLIDLLSGFLELFYVATVVDCYERAVVLRLGKFKKVLEPGLHFRFPLAIDKVLKANVVLDTQELPAQAFTTKDGVSVVVSAVAAFKIRDIQRFLLEVEDAESVLADASRGTIRNILCAKTWRELQEGGDEIDEELTKAVRHRAVKWGIDVVHLTLSDLTKARTYRHLVDGALSSDTFVQRDEG